jgi:hypothetical protein
VGECGDEAERTEDVKDAASISWRKRGCRSLVPGSAYRMAGMFRPSPPRENMTAAENMFMLPVCAVKRWVYDDTMTGHGGQGCGGGRSPKLKLFHGLRFVTVPVIVLAVMAAALLGEWLPALLAGAVMVIDLPLRVGIVHKSSERRRGGRPGEP